MNTIQEFFMSFRLVVLGETTCRLFFVSSPIIWVFGCFFLGVSAITIYSKFTISPFTVYLVVFGIFMLLSGIFSASNTIHVCIQLPTSPVALKIQKIGQLIILSGYIILILIGFGISGDQHSDGYYGEDQIKVLNSDYETLFYHEITFLALFFVTTLSCMLS